MPKIKINGKELEVKAGSSIIEAFKQMGEDIAHYCWHPGLSVAGVCRLCMVEIEGNPRLQIACNTTVQDGMVISNKSEKVEEAVRWGLDFHLINHPLDCPICDQAGECGLQDQYMQFGKYDPEMAEPKVKKHKVVDLGERVVLDSERCILCSRCVRFTEEVSKTFELGIFNRGDRSEIGTFENKPLNNNYSLNTVDICPVGALTSKDFRFRQRVWYLKDAETICTGCSTGCNVKVYYNEEGLFRVKPVFNEEINGHWMCDVGRETYKFVNRNVRLTMGKYSHNGQTEVKSAGAAARDSGAKLREVVKEHGAGSVALVVTGQYSQEEYKSLLDYFCNDLGSNQVYHWVNNPENFDDFDGLLFRGDRNPNTKGLLDTMAAFNLSAAWGELESKLNSGQVKMIMVAGPENQTVYPDMNEKIELFSKADESVWLTAGKNATLDQVVKPTWQVPLKTFFEKDGTYVNYAGKAQSVKRGTTVIPGALTLAEAADLMAGKPVDVAHRPDAERHLKQNYFVGQKGVL